jgi:hypothetical protein
MSFAKLINPPGIMNTGNFKIEVFKSCDNECKDTEPKLKDPIVSLEVGVTSNFYTSGHLNNYNFKGAERKVQELTDHTITFRTGQEVPAYKQGLK